MDPAVIAARVQQLLVAARATSGRLLRDLVRDSRSGSTLARGGSLGALVGQLASALRCEASVSSWRRPDRRFWPVVKLPGSVSSPSLVLAIAIDTSGSMPEDAVAQCIAIATQVARFDGVHVHVFLHTERCYWHGPAADFTPVRVRSGGTSHIDVSAQIERWASTSRVPHFAVLLLTDCQTVWPQDAPAWAKRACVGAFCGGQELLRDRHWVRKMRVRPIEIPD